MGMFNKFAEANTIKYGKSTSFGHLPDKSETNLWLTDAMIISRMKTAISEFSFSVNLGRKTEIEHYFYAMLELWDFIRTTNRRKSRETVDNMDKSFDYMEIKVLNIREQCITNPHQKIKPEFLISLRIMKRELFQICQDWGFGTPMREKYDATKALENAVLG